MTTALITGASSGIGLDLAKMMADDGINLVLVARSTDKLQALKAELDGKVDVTVISKDLAEKDAAQDVYNQTKAAGIHVDYLVNNAGFGDFGPFIERDWDKNQTMIDLNITVLTHLTKLYLDDMAAAGTGKILNVASTAAFQPGPWMAVYYATKAYVLSFSEALAYEMRNSGVTVTTLCPGPTETGFVDAADMQDSKLFKLRKPATSEAVARQGYKKMLKGQRVTIQGTMNWLMAQSNRFSPRGLVLVMVDKISGASKK